MTEWLTHVAFIEATCEEAARDQTRQLWADNAEHHVFFFKDCGVDGVSVEELLP